MKASDYWKAQADELLGKTKKIDPTKGNEPPTPNTNQTGQTDSTPQNETPYSFQDEDDEDFDVLDDGVLDIPEYEISGGGGNDVQIQNDVSIGINIFVFSVIRTEDKKDINESFEYIKETSDFYDTLENIGLSNKKIKGVKEKIKGVKVKNFYDLAIQIDKIQNINNIYFVGHGSFDIGWGGFYVGDEYISLTNIANYQHYLKNLGKKMSKFGRLFLLSCHTAGGGTYFKNVFPNPPLTKPKEEDFVKNNGFLNVVAEYLSALENYNQKVEQNYTRIQKFYSEQYNKNFVQRDIQEQHKREEKLIKMAEYLNRPIYAHQSWGAHSQDWIKTGVLASISQIQKTDYEFLAKKRAIDRIGYGTWTSPDGTQLYVHSQRIDVESNFGEIADAKVMKIHRLNGKIK